MPSQPVLLNQTPAPQQQIPQIVPQQAQLYHGAPTPAPAPQVMNLPANGNVIIDGEPYTITSATAVPMNAVSQGNAVPQPAPAPAPAPVQQITPVGNGVYGVLQSNPVPQPQQQPPQTVIVQQQQPPQPPPQREVLLNPATVQDQSQVKVS